MTDTQPALATTKRKFHRLVDSITASTSTTSLASTLQESNTSSTSLAQRGSPEPPNKRPRSSNASMERSVSSSQARIQALKDQLLKDKLSTPQRAGTVRVVGKGTTTSTSTARKPPNFQPYSKEQFLSRVKTFADVKKWTTKPDAISEIEWARRGWSCDTWNTVACKGGCEKRVAVKLHPKRKDASAKVIEMSEDLTVDVGDKLVERFRELIVEGHAEDCFRATCSADLLSRYQSFASVSADLPLLENITYPEPSVKDILQRLPSTLFGSASAPSSSADIVAFTFALSGWSGVSESRISLATCDHCFQRLGLWLSSNTRLQEMSKKLDVSIESLRLNLLESHREHCPWKNAAAQANPSDGPIANMAAWQTLQFILLPKQRNSPQKTGHTRNVESVDLGSEAEYPRGSIDSYHANKDKEEVESIEGKWKRFKAKLRRTTSKKSLKSLKSVRSGKSRPGTAGTEKDVDRP
ncbi:zf-C3HC-domain-containing protein [Setomelanomma holmii]|uniref:Zf-C3HC-domain-containing protein n=1 Tax=Setomelanomma holmii TaxID=210430 RepID=A0A9P4LHX7_9PLEO|nr:zf-C3HC-domain-containing protein [Setomelanomma holmii]